MSGYDGNIRKGQKVRHRGKIKIIKDWHFTALDGCHNSDTIVIQFTDNTEAIGFSNIVLHPRIAEKKSL